MAHDVFISFSFKDQHIADKIVNHLANLYGISCWICTEKIRAGEYYYDLIAEAISTCKILVFVQTKNSVESKEIPDEILTAIDEGKTIISFIVEPSELRGQMKLKLNHRQHIDATKPTLDERIKDLAKDICRSLGKPFQDCSANQSEEQVTYKLISSRIQASTTFYGREDILAHIHEKFSSDERIVFLKGMGGIGKSEIAKQYAKRYKKEYDAIVWMRYDGSLLNLIIDDNALPIEGLCRKTKADNSLQTDEEYALEKLEILSDIASERTLIIVDNYDTSFDDYLAQFLSKGVYKILFTTRMEQERRRYCVLSINEIENDDALKDLVIDYCNSEYQYIDRDDEAFSELFELTNRHTLTLELIAQYMEEATVDLSEMVERLKQNGFCELSNAQLIRDNEEQFGFEYISRIFHMVKLSSAEQQFLRYMSLMPKQGIEEHYFKAWCGEFYHCRTSLQKKSWIQYDSKNKIVSLHPIVHEVVNRELPITYENCKSFLDSYLETVEEERHWNTTFETKQIMYACCQNIISKMPLNSDEMLDLYYGMVHAYIFVANYADGIKYLNHLYDYLCQRSKEDTDIGGKILFKMGWLHLWKGNFDEARLWLEDRAYPILQKNLNLNCANEYTHCIREIGSVYYRMYRNQRHQAEFLEKAEQYYRRSFIEINHITENSIDEKLSLLLEKRRNGLYMNIGRVLVERKEYDLAKEYLFRAKEWFDVQSGIEGDQSSIYFSIGDYFLAINDGQSVEYLKIAVDYSKKTLTRFSFSSMAKLRSLAKAYEIIHDCESALETYKEIIEIARVILVPTHPILGEVSDKISELTQNINI